MFETSRANTSSKTIQRLPVIGEPSDKQGDKRESTCAKTSLNPQISFPKLTSRENVSISEQKKSATVSHAITLLNSLKCSQDIQQLIAEKGLENSNNSGLSECRLLFRVPSSEINNNEFETERGKLEESNALKRWEFWAKDRIRLQDYFSKHLERNICDLQFNELDKFRERVENRTLFEYSQIPDADKWRGHPYRWKPPLCLSKRQSPECDLENSPRYCAVKSKLEEGEIPEIEFIGIPKAIQKEKGLVCKSEKSPKKDWERPSYRQERITHFMKQKRRLKLHNIQMDELAVVGIKIPQKQEETIRSSLPKNVPEICITSDDEDPKNSFDYRQSIFCLIIQGEEIKYEIGTHDCSRGPDKVFTWQVDFGVNKIGCLADKILRVENRGTIAVRYDWISENIEKELLLDHPKMKQREPWFFFDKNSGFFLPGQIYDLKFYCRAKHSGIRKEVWHLKTKPPLCQSQKMGSVILSVVATKELWDEREALLSYLKKRVRDSAVNSVIQILFYKVFNSTEGLRDVEYRSLFCEKELFENHNLKYYYHSKVVRALKELIQKIPSKNQSDWDFSLDTLVSLVKTNQEEEEEKNSLFFQIAKEAQKLLRPSYVSVKYVKKYRMTFQILCCMANFAEEDYDYIRNLISPEMEEQPEEKTYSDTETEELFSTYSFISEELSNSDYSEVALHMKSRHFLFIQMMFYLKMYKRVCEAIEQIAGVLESNRLFQPRKRFDYKLEKPSRMNSSTV